MFIELWQGLRDLMHENSGSNSQETGIVKPKLFINWTINDLGARYNWPFLSDSQQVTGISAEAEYPIGPITQLVASAETLYFTSNNSSDTGTITVKGKQVPGSNANYINVLENIVLNGTASISSANTFSHIDAFKRVLGTNSGQITITKGTGGTVCVMSSTDTYASNDISTINFVLDTTNEVEILPLDLSTPENMLEVIKASANRKLKYVISPSNTLKLLNVITTVDVTVYYQMRPTYLINDIEQPDFPRHMYSKIINAAYEGYGLRYEDEADAIQGKMRYNLLLDEIIADYTKGVNNRINRRVIPSNYKRVS